MRIGTPRYTGSQNASRPMAVWYSHKGKVGDGILLMWVNNEERGKKYTQILWDVVSFRWPRSFRCCCCWNNRNRNLCDSPEESGGGCGVFSEPIVFEGPGWCLPRHIKEVAGGLNKVPRPIRRRLLQLNICQNSGNEKNIWNSACNFWSESWHTSDRS